MAEGRLRGRRRAGAAPLTVVDASVWVSALAATEAGNAASRSWLERHARSGRAVVSPSLLLPEVAAAISRRTGKPALGRRAVAALLRWPGVRLVELDDALARLAARLAADLALRGADAVYVAVARELGTPLVTWDREQLERGARVVAASTPLEVE